MAIYWEPLVRWSARRAEVDAKTLDVPVVYLQSWDECSTLEPDARARLLTVANIHTTGHMHGFLLAHVGMRVRLTAKFNASLGLVQEQKATIVDFLFHDMDSQRYRNTPGGTMFTPNCMPAALILKVDNFTASPAAGHVLFDTVPGELASSMFFSADGTVFHVAKWSRLYGEACRVSANARCLFDKYIVPGTDPTSRSHYRLCSSCRGHKNHERWRLVAASLCNVFTGDANVRHVTPPTASSSVLGAWSAATLTASSAYICGESDGLSRQGRRVSGFVCHRFATVFVSCSYKGEREFWTTVACSWRLMCRW